MHTKAVDTVRCLLSWHDSDIRYASPEARKRVAALYLPLLTVSMDALPFLYHWGGDNSERYAENESGPSNINQTVALAIAGTLSPNNCESFQTVSYSINIK